MSHSDSLYSLDLKVNVQMNLPHLLGLKRFFLMWNCLCPLEYFLVFLCLITLQGFQNESGNLSLMLCGLQF